jgi:hypothetical protein
MPEEIPQFFEKSPVNRKGGVGSNLAVYTIASEREGQAPIEVLVECREGLGNVPQNVAFFGEVQKFSLDVELQKIRQLAQKFVETFKPLTPGEVEVEFGIELGGEGKIPMITKFEAKANFKVKLKWSQK